uniref:Uncharacterized protein n=1 Tax=Ditylenchus dipsaci TaxID=166011 RepID=A0A915CQI3_9BILA
MLGFQIRWSQTNALLNMNGTEELLSTRQPFIRLSSARSSFASTGWNRYFQNRSAHGTQESTMLLGADATTIGDGIAPLNMLGQEEETSASCSHEKYDSLLDSAQEEIGDFNSQYDILSNPIWTTSNLLTKESQNEAEYSVRDNISLSNGSVEVVKHVPPYAAAINSTNWLIAKDLSEFSVLLEQLPPLISHPDQPWKKI